MSKPDINNTHIARLRKLLKRKTKKDQPYLFYNARNDLFDTIWQNRDKIIAEDRINIKDLYDGIDNDYPDTLYSVNKKRFVDDPVNEHHKYTVEEETKNQIIELLKSAIEAPDNQNEILTTESREEFKDVITEFDEEFDEDIDDESDTLYLKPQPSFNYSSFAMNFLYHNNIQYVFNPDIQKKSLSKNSNFFTAKFEIVSFLDTLDYPTRYTATCTHKNRYGEECGNIVYFSHVHKHSTVKCTDSMETAEGMDSHRIKNLSEAEVRGGDMIKLYAYTVKDIDSDGSDGISEEFILYSMKRLNEYIVEGNIVDAKRGNDRLRILVSKKNTDPKTLDDQILKQNTENYTFLHDVYESVKDYLGEYHGITLTNQNRVVGEFIIFQILCNLYFDFSFKSLIAGKSGSGKSFFAKFIVPLFTNAQTIVSGNDVTRNRLLGGRANYNSTLFNSPYSPGYIATHDVVVLEEMTNQISLFTDPSNKYSSQNVNNNVMSMLKGVDDKGQEYDVGIQGSMKSRVRASTIMIGNLEQLHHIRAKYIKRVRQHYNKMQRSEEQNFSSRWPLYKPVEFYHEYMKNESLAKAHQKVRKELLPTNHITNLPEAEQNRLLVMIILEDFETGYKPIKTNMQDGFESYIHREELESELKDVFDTELNQDLYREVEEFMNHEFFAGRNNFVIDKSMNYNTHIRVKLMKFAALLVHMNKLYWGNENLSELTEDDKNLIEYYLLYNYNTLSMEEASMKKKPYINDLVLDNDKIDREFDKAEEQETVAKKTKNSGIDIGDILDVDNEDESNTT